MKRATLLGSLLVLLLVASTVETSTHDYWNSFSVPAGDTLGVRAKDFGSGAYFQGTWSFWWDEGTADRLIVTLYDLYDSSATTPGVRAVKVATYKGGWSYGERPIGDSASFDASACSDTVHGDVVGDAKDFRFYGRNR